MPLEIATCQFPVSADVRANRRHVLRQMAIAEARGADVAHFPECALSGYAGTDFASHDGFDWDGLRAAAAAVLRRAAELGLWVVVGSAHRLTPPHKPHDSAYVIDPNGRIVDRYDKRFCGGDAAERAGDLAHYSPGDHFTTFEVGGVRCGVMICHDYRYPELARAYKRLGVEVIFHSFHAGHASPERVAAALRELGQPAGGDGRSTVPGLTMPATAVATAASSHLWISASNTSARESMWPSFVVRPDGVVAGRLRLNAAGVLITSIAPGEGFYDSTAAWRDRAMAGVLHSGTLVDDPRSDDRTSL